MTDPHHAALAIHGAEPDATLSLPQRRTTMRRAKWFVLALLTLLALGAIASIILRVVHARALDASTTEQARRYVAVINARADSAAEPLSLPGSLQGLVEAPIYARSSGYLLRWYKDIGSHVTKGEVLAEIDTPEVDQQLSQAIAARGQAASSLELAKSSAARWEALRQKDAVSQQELDERHSAYLQAEANLQAADANMRRLQQTKDFKRVTAPFDGVITQRNVNIGDLIDAGTGDHGRALFMLSQIDQLRIYIYVPQTYAQTIKVGQSVAVTQAELPDQVFHGKVARTAGAIDLATRTLQIEVNLPNHDGKLLAGSYVAVSLPVTAASTGLVVPGNTLLFRAEGTRIGVVDQNNHVRLQPVTIGRDFGATVEILSGITAKDALIVNPPDSLADGEAVTIAQPSAPVAPAPTSTAGKAGA
jgi:RND family efflux transporter MFP subunit